MLTQKFCSFQHDEVGKRCRAVRAEWITERDHCRQEEHIEVNPSADLQLSHKKTQCFRIYATMKFSNQAFCCLGFCWAVSNNGVNGFSNQAQHRAVPSFGKHTDTSTSLSVANDDNVGEATQRLGQLAGPTVWTAFGQMAQEYGVDANLGQGFPDWTPPKFAVDSLVEAATDVQQSPHQYTRTEGHPNLVKQLAGRYSVHMKREIDAMKEVAVTVGASQALYLSLQTLVKPGKRAHEILGRLIRSSLSHTHQLLPLL